MKFRGVSQEAGEFLTQLAEQSPDGQLHRGAVLEAARPADSPIHKDVFDCDKKRASERYFLQRAEDLIRKVYVTTAPTKTNGKPKKVYVRMFHNLDRGTNAYDTITQIESDETKQAKLLAQSWRDLESWRKKYEDLKGVIGVWKTIDRALEKRGGEASLGPARRVVASSGKASPA